MRDWYWRGFFNGGVVHGSGVVHASRWRLREGMMGLLIKGHSLPTELVCKPLWYDTTWSAPQKITVSFQPLRGSFFSEYLCTHLQRVHLYEFLGAWGYVTERCCETELADFSIRRDSVVCKCATCTIFRETPFMNDSENYEKCTFGLLLTLPVHVLYILLTISQWCCT